MGGLGSGNPYLNGNRRPRRPNTSEVPRIGIADVRDKLPALATRESVRLVLTVALRDGREAQLPFRVESIPTNFGDGRRRWLFQCPVCERHVAHLYVLLTKLSDKLACRHCHGLSYKSAQQAHWAERWMRQAARIERLLDNARQLRERVEAANHAHQRRH